jgi:hypothetical protein
MLEQQSGSQCIDVPLSAAGRATHFSDGPQRSGGREPFVHETHGEPSSFLQLGGNVTRLASPRRVVAVFIEREAHDEPLHSQLGAATNHLGDRWALVTPA